MSKREREREERRERREPKGKTVDIKKQQRTGAADPARGAALGLIEALKHKLAQLLRNVRPGIAHGKSDLRGVPDREMSGETRLKRSVRFRVWQTGGCG